MYSWYATASKSGYNLGASPTWAFTYQPSPVTAPSLDLFPPQISGLTVTANGVALPGTAGTSITRINWIWGDGTSEDAWFPATHTYTQAGTYTISVTAYQSDGLSTTKNMQVVLVEGGSELSYDDGSAEFGFIAWPHAVAAVRFTPSSPIQLVGVKFYVFGAMNPVKIHVFDSNLRLLYSQTVTPSEGWYLVDISSASIYVNRDFYVGWEWPNGGEPWFGVDNNSPSAGRSYLFTLGDSNLGLPRANENYMIRAIVAPAPTFTANLGARSNLGETLTGLKAYVDGVVYVLPNTATLTKGSHKFATSPEFSTSTLSYIFDHWEDEAGTIVSTSGFFTYDLKTNKSFYAVYKPKPAAGQLALSVTAPSTSTVATEFEVSATLSNVGGGRVDSIVFKIILPPGMALRTGEAASISVGSLTPGASTSQVWHVTSSAQGTRTLFVAAWGIGEDGRVVATFQRLTITINVSGQQELKYDGGTPNFGANPTSSGLAYLINIYSLPAGWQSAKIVTVRYYIYANPAKFKVHIFDSNRADLITPVEVTPQSTGWFDVDLSAWNIVVSGDFYVAIEYAMPGGPDIGSHYPPEWGQYRSTSPTWYGSGPSGQGWVNVLENAYIRVVVSTNVAATSQDGKSMGLGVDKNFEPFCHASSPQRMPTMWRKDASALAVAVPEKSTSLRGQALSATRIMGLQVGHL
jgi:PKD repeat protein